MGAVRRAIILDSTSDGPKNVSIYLHEFVENGHIQIKGNVVKIFPTWRFWVLIYIYIYVYLD